MTAYPSQTWETSTQYIIANAILGKLQADTTIKAYFKTMRTDAKRNDQWGDFPICNIYGNYAGFDIRGVGNYREDYYYYYIEVATKPTANPDMYMDEYSSFDALYSRVVGVLQSNFYTKYGISDSSLTFYPNFMQLNWEPEGMSNKDLMILYRIIRGKVTKRS